MLIFASAGLDVFVKQLIKSKLPKLLRVDKVAQFKFKEYVKRGLNKNDKEILNVLAFALIDRNPRRIFLDEYIQSMTGESLQSVDELMRVSEASGLNTKMIFTNEKMNSLKDVFKVRNEIIHAMDINTSNDNFNTTGYRTRRQRVSTKMEQHTKNILNLAEELFSVFKKKFEDLSIDVDKRPAA